MDEQSLVVSAPCLATAVLSPAASSSRSGNNVARIQRNVAEKQRRDKLNGYINELANIVPMISKSARRLDKTSILRLSAAHLRICKSPLGANSKIKKAFAMCNNFLSDERIREILESVDGFLIITASNGKILFTSRSVERYLGHQDIDMIGHSLYMFIHEKDVDDIKQKMKDMLAECLEKGSSRRSFECLMKEKAQPRSEVSTYQHIHFVGGMNQADDQNSENRSKSVITHMFKAFAKIVDISPYNHLSLEEATADEYVTRHSLDGTIIYADHRLATMTGHMPNEVIGLSAYDFIHKIDLPVTLFAHHLMFTNDQGTGIIVYRLQTRDNRYIYLKSVGCLQHDKVNARVDHFVCVNQQLGDSEGDVQLKYFFDRYIPHVKGSSTLDLLKSVKALQSSPESSDINHEAIIEPVASQTVDLETSPTSSPGSSDSTISSLSSDSSTSSNENSPECVMEHDDDCNQIASQENVSSLPTSPEIVDHNGSVSPDSSVLPPDELENDERELGATSNGASCFIVTVNGSSSGVANGFFTSSVDSPLNVDQDHSVNTPNKIESPPFQISRNSPSLTKGPNNQVNSNLRMIMGPVLLNSNGETSSGINDDSILQIDSQYEHVGSPLDSDLNKSGDRYLLLKSNNFCNGEHKNPVEYDEKLDSKMNLNGHQLNGKLSLSQNGISSEGLNSSIEAQPIYSLLKANNISNGESKILIESDGKVSLYDHQLNGKLTLSQNGFSSDKNLTVSNGKVSLYDHQVNGKLSLSQNGFSSDKNLIVSNGKVSLHDHDHQVNGKLSLSQNGFSSDDSSSPLVEQSDILNEDVFDEDTAESFLKHSSLIRNNNGVDGYHSTLTVVNSCDSDSVFKSSKWYVDSFSVFQSTVEESSLSMDYCDTMPTSEGGINGDLKDSISLQEDLPSLLSATLPHSDSNSLPSANGWNDVFSSTEYSSPFSNETTVQKDEEQLLVNSSKVKSYDLW